VNFKQCAIADLEAIFDELGELHFIASEEINVIIDDEKLKKRQSELGIAETGLLFMAKTKDLPFTKDPDDYLEFDGQGYIINEWSDTDGMTTVLLSATS